MALTNGERLLFAFAIWKKFMQIIQNRQNSQVIFSPAFNPAQVAEKLGDVLSMVTGAIHGAESLPIHFYLSFTPQQGRLAMNLFIKREADGTMSFAHKIYGGVWLGDEAIDAEAYAAGLNDLSEWNSLLNDSAVGTAPPLPKPMDVNIGSSTVTSVVGSTTPQCTDPNGCAHVFPGGTSIYIP